MNDVLRHIASDNPRVMVVDGSKVARTLIARVLEKDLPGATVIACAMPRTTHIYPRSRR